MRRTNLFALSAIICLGSIFSGAEGLLRNYMVTRQLLGNLFPSYSNRRPPYSPQYQNPPRYFPYFPYPQQQPGGTQSPTQSSNLIPLPGQSLFQFGQQTGQFQSPPFPNQQQPQPFPGQQQPQPFPGQQQPQPFPGQQLPQPFPGQQLPQPFPGQQQPQPFPGQQQPQPFPGQQLPQPFPGQQQPQPFPTQQGFPQFPFVSPTTPSPYLPLNQAQPVGVKREEADDNSWILNFFVLNQVQKKFTATTAETTPSPVAPYVLPDEFAGWFQVGNCWYQRFIDQRTYDSAIDSCKDKSANLAVLNVKGESERNTILTNVGATTLGVWIGVEDVDGEDGPTPPRWIDFSFFAGTPDYESTGSDSMCGLAGTSLSPTLEFVPCTNTQAYLCEFCPAL